MPVRRHRHGGVDTQTFFRLFLDPENSEGSYTAILEAVADVSEDRSTESDETD